jgi:adenylate cyclase
MLNLGNARYDPAARLLYQADGQEVPIRPQTLKVLEFLIQGNGAVQSKEALMQAVWTGLAVTDDSLTQCIREIRQAIGDDDHRILQTVHRRGYRLVVNHVSASASNGNVETNTVPLALAVMPFTSLRGDEGSERFAKSFAADLLSKLALHALLPLISRQESFALQGQALSASEFSVKLKARYVVTGQVQVTDGSAQWSLEMVEGETNRVVWSENQRANFTNVEIELDALLQRISGTIQNFFLQGILNRSAAHSPTSEEPFDKYARVLNMMQRSTPESAVEAQRLAALLVAEQPHYSQAWFGLALTHLFDTYRCYTGQSTDARIVEVLARLYKSIEMDRTNPMPYSFLAQALCCNGQFEEAQVVLRKAHQLAPSDVMQLTSRAQVHFFSGRLNDALRCAEESLAVASGRPLTGLADRGRALVFLNREAEGIENLSECVVMTPGHNWARMALIVALHETGEHAKAAHHYTELLKYTRNFDRTFFGRLWSAIPVIRDRYIEALSAHGLL